MPRVVSAGNILMHQFGEEAVILNLNNETYYRLNGIAIDMWKALTGSESVEAALAALLTQYDVPEAELQRDLEEFITYLQTAQIAVAQEQ